MYKSSSLGSRRYSGTEQKEKKTGGSHRAQEGCEDTSPANSLGRNSLLRVNTQSVHGDFDTVHVKFGVLYVERLTCTCAEGSSSRQTQDDLRSIKKLLRVGFFGRWTEKSWGRPSCAVSIDVV